MALGLKVETADMYYYALERYNGNCYEPTGEYELCHAVDLDNRTHFEYLHRVFGVTLEDDETRYFIPAWSLSRLIEIADTQIAFDPICTEDLYMGLKICGSDKFDHIIQIIENKVANEYYNREYFNYKEE